MTGCLPAMWKRSMRRIRPLVALGALAATSRMWESTAGDVELTLAGYYQGLRSVHDNGLYATERYIATVLALRDRFR